MYRLRRLAIDVLGSSRATLGLVSAVGYVLHCHAQMNLRFSATKKQVPPEQMSEAMRREFMVDGEYRSPLPVVPRRPPMTIDEELAELDTVGATEEGVVLAMTSFLENRMTASEAAIALLQHANAMNALCP